MADIVAKLSEDRLARNNRIQTGGFLNQGCVLDSNFELLLRARRPKIVLQQYRHVADLSCPAAGCRLIATKQTHDVEQDKVSL
jgi:hypothetical protein